MRMMLPPLALRRTIDGYLTEFFQSHKESAFNRAISSICRFYAIRRPKIEWYEYIDWGKTAGKTFENGIIYLIHPANWKRGRVYKSERMWIQIVYHEMAHFLFWADAERKADSFTRRMVYGLRARPSRTAPADSKLSGKRVAAAKPAAALRRRARARGKSTGSRHNRG